MKNKWINIVRLMRNQWNRLPGVPADLSSLADAAKPLLIVCAVTLASFLLVDIFYKIAGFQIARHPSYEKSPLAAVASFQEQWHPAERYHVITQRNLLQTTLKAIIDKNAGGLPGPRDEYTAFDLKGTIAINQSMGYAIVEEKGKGKQKLYRLGEMIGSAKLVRVTRSTAVLADGEKEFVMKIKESAEGIPGRSGRDITLSKQTVTEGLGDLKSIMSQAIVRPFFHEGAQQGYVVSNIVPGSLYQKLGLQNGDVVMDVNNKKLESADDILQLVNVMQDGESVSINLMRGGKKESVNYTFH
jgi:general secretion pathway protein C